MADEGDEQQTLKEKLLFYTTAFFILLGTFSLFAFLFLVPFVIDPAFTTIFMQFDTNPATCVTVDIVQMRGASNCSWSSCREGCTKELYECLQIRVNYRVAPNLTSYNDSLLDLDFNRQPHVVPLDGANTRSGDYASNKHRDGHRKRRAIRDYDYDLENYYIDSLTRLSKLKESAQNGNNAEPPFSYNDEREVDDGTFADDYEVAEYGNVTEQSEWFTMARLFPNVKGCGYPPYLNCTIWTKKYKQVGTNFSCYYSKVDPGLVISDLDLWQNTLNLVYAMAIPIPSFIISVIYLTFAYFKIYNEDEEQAPLDKNAEEMADDDELGVLSDEELGIEIGDDEVCIVLENGSDGDPENGNHSGPTTTLLTTNSTDLQSSFAANQLKVHMIDDLSRASSIDQGPLISHSGSIPGYRLKFFKSFCV